MMKRELHPTFQQILENALNVQIEREHKKVVQPKQRNPETYLEFHENRDELRYVSNGYVRNGY